MGKADTVIRDRRTELGKFKAPQAPDKLVGCMLAERYMVQEKIGEGGMGTVYLAEDTKLGKKVALKVLPKYLAAMPSVTQRFVQEAKVAPRIEHENVIDVTDLGTTPDGIPFFVMEYLKGIDLYQAMGSGAGGWTKRNAEIMLQVCRALSAAHEKGVIHRDMKPENVFLPERSDGSVFVKLLDFGVAKLLEHARVLEEDENRVLITETLTDARMTQAGVIMGTPAYMAPEQAKGADVDHRADIYAVGTIMYEMVCGAVPFEPEGYEGMMRARMILEMQVSAEPAPPGKRRPDLKLPPDLEAVIMKALRKNPDERFQSMKEMEEAIAAVPVPGESQNGKAKKEIRMGSLSVLGYREMKKAQKARKARLRNIVVAAALAALAALAGLSYAFRHSIAERMHPPERMMEKR